MADHCIKCGDCCEITFLSDTKTGLRKKLVEGIYSGKDAISVKFILKNWTRLNKSDHKDRMRELLGYDSTKNFIYTCNMFNKETRECEAYDLRPPVCSDFPWYGKEPDDGSGLPLRCSFRPDYVEVPVELSTTVIR